MLNKKLVLWVIFVIFLLSISTSAAQDNTTDIKLAGDFNSSDLKLNSQSFTALNNAINDNYDDEVYLNSDYGFDSDLDVNFKEGIVIDRAVTVNGNGHKIDGNGGARIFNVINSDVVFKNIVFTNSKSEGNGGAVTGVSTAINCTFTNNSADNGGAVSELTAKDCIFADNYAKSNGGAMYYGSAENCVFINNTANSGGALYYAQVTESIFNDNNAKDKGGAIYGAFFCEKSTFIHNSALNYGGAIYIGYKIVNSTFRENNASWGGAIDSGNAEDCIFIGNIAAYGGGAIFGDGIYITSNSMFEDNSAKDGGATYEMIAIKCNFTNNIASQYGGAMYGKNATDCYFKDNTAGIGGSNVYNTTIINHVLNVFISAYDVTTVYNRNNFFVVTLKDSNNNPVSYAKLSVDIAGVKYLTTDIKGQVRLTTNALIPRTYTVSIRFDGDDNYASSFATAKIVVSKASVKLKVSKTTFKKSVKNKKCHVVLKNNLNKVMKNVKITLKVKNKKYSTKTNSKGVATFKIIKLTKKGTYKAIVTYAGNKYYNKLTKKINIKVK